MDWIPILSQFKSLVQAAAGDADGAMCTQEAFTRSCPLIAQVRSVGEFCAGDFEGAKKTQMESVHTLSRICNSIPIIGHIKGLLHYICDDGHGCHLAMRSSTRNLGVVVAASTGFMTLGPAGSLAAGPVGGVLMDVVITQTWSAMGKPEPHGYIALVHKVCSLQGCQKSGPMFELTAVPILDALAGYGSALELSHGGSAHVPGHAQHHHHTGHGGNVVHQHQNVDHDLTGVSGNLHATGMYILPATVVDVGSLVAVYDRSPESTPRILVTGTPQDLHAWTPQSTPHILLKATMQHHPSDYEGNHDSNQEGPTTLLARSQSTPRIMPKAAPRDLHFWTPQSSPRILLNAAMQHCPCDAKGKKDSSQEEPPTLLATSQSTPRILLKASPQDLHAWTPQSTPRIMLNVAMQHSPVGGEGQQKSSVATTQYVHGRRELVVQVAGLDKRSATLESVSTTEAATSEGSCQGSFR